jgi:high-affinity Fe2+/Pb2+ permease
MNPNQSSMSNQSRLFWLSVVLLALCLGTEVTVLVKGLPQGTSELVIGRVLGLLDAITMTVLAYWYGTSSSSAVKTELLVSSSR